MNLSAFNHRVWAIESGALRALDMRAAALSSLMAAGMEPTANELTPDQKRIAYNGGNPLTPVITNGIATIEFHGDIVARAPWFAKAYLGVVDPHDLADALDTLAADPAVSRVIIEMDSCGGTTDGTAEAAAAIVRTQSAGKVVEIHAAGTLASAAYWIASQADRIIATPTTRIGSLGTMIGLCDTTAADAAMGVRYEVVASAPLKGLGFDGAVTPAMRGEAKRTVDALTMVFRDAVASGRGFTDTQINAVFTGQCWLAGEALALGLIDAVATGSESPETASGTETPPPPTLPPVESDQADTDESTPASATSAATNETEPPMALAIAALAILAAAHPDHAALILNEGAKEGATEGSIKAAVHAAETAKAVKVKDDEIAALKAKLSDSETAKAKAESDAKTKDQELAKLKAHGTTHRDPGGDDPGKEVRKVSAKDYQAMDLSARAAFHKEGGLIVE